MDDERYNAVDFVKCFAAFAIVCIHTEPFHQVTVLNMSGEYVLFVIDTLARFAVPFFFVVSGFFFMKKIMTTKDGGESYCIKYLKNIAQLYFGWSVFYFLFNVGKKLMIADVDHNPFHSELIPELSAIPIFKMLISIVYYGYASPHLWYLIALLWSVGILFVFIKYHKLNTLLLISFVLYIIGLFGNSYRGIIHFPLTTRNALFFGLFYCTLGSWFAYHEKAICEKISKVGVSTFGYLFWIFCGLQMIERAILVRFFGGSSLEHDYFVMTIPLSICLFLWILGAKNQSNRSFVACIAKNSVGIYVIHYCLIGILTDMLINIGVEPKTVSYQLLFTPLVFVVALIAYRYLQYMKLRLKSFVY